MKKKTKQYKRKNHSTRKKKHGGSNKEITILFYPSYRSVKEMGNLVYLDTSNDTVTSFNEIEEMLSAIISDSPMDKSRIKKEVIKITNTKP